MTTGLRRLRINTQERAVSTDINRLQAFAGREFEEFARVLLDNQFATDDPSIDVGIFSVGAPVSAEILSGLLVKPQAGAFGLTIDPGSIGIVSGAPSGDDSGYSMIRDAGVPSLGTLAIAANVSGSVRIDVVECSIDSSTVVVTDSRDIFNPSTGLFVASSVTKETQGRLAYRVRQGTPGAGLPASQTGWLPLAVVRVPNSAASNDVCTFWDVRPMVSDRLESIQNRSSGPRDLVDADMTIVRLTSTDIRMVGSINASFRGRRAGGPLSRGVPGTLSAYLEVDPVNGAVAEPVSALQTLYLCFPGGLPRWARYTDGPSNRVPHAPFGIPVFSTVPSTFDLIPNGAITMPTGLDLGTTVATTNAIAVSIVSNSSTVYSPALCRRREMTLGFAGGQSVTGSYDSGTGNLDFVVPNTMWPANAKAASMTVQFTIQIGASPGALLISPNLEVNEDTAAFASTARDAIHYMPPYARYNPSGSPANFAVILATGWIPRPTLLGSFGLRINVGAGATISATSVVMKGYRF
jgi:hypothetical protein